MKNKDRLDNLLMGRAMFPSRESARTAIMDGAILVNGQKVTKAGAATATDANIEIIKSYNMCPYVSRGGLKLERALEYFQVAVNGRTAVDAGASTGGFTDCLLKKGARFVYAVDVGHSQLDWSLRQNKNVRVLERVNIRGLTPEVLYGDADDKEPQNKADLGVMDVSFISVTKTLPSLVGLLSAEKQELLILIKPQFEAGREKVGKGGVVRDIAVHREVLDTVISFALTLRPFRVGLTHSPIKGPMGNIEYLLHLLSCDEKNESESGSESESDSAQPRQSTVADLASEKAAEAFAALGAP